MSEQSAAAGGGNRNALIALSWAWVTIPFLYVFWQLLLKLPALFG